VIRLNFKTKAFVDSSFGQYLLARPWGTWPLAGDWEPK
jgi:hypothetical protein